MHNSVPYLKYLVSSKKSSISGNDPISINLLNDNVDQRCFIATHYANSQFNVRIGSMNFNGSDLSFRQGRWLLICCQLFYKKKDD